MGKEQQGLTYGELKAHLRSKERSIVCPLLRKINRAEDNEVLERASTDEITGLKTMSYLEEAWRVVKGRVERCKDITILLGDLDGLKRTNDGISYDAANTVLRRTGNIINNILKQTGTIIMSQIREGGLQPMYELERQFYSEDRRVKKFVSDVAARYNKGGAGDEFIIVLYGTKEQGGKSLGERLVRLAREDQKLREHGHTLTIGVASRNGSADIFHIIKMAEEAKKYGKNNGKDGCYIYSEIFGTEAIISK